MKKKDVLDYFGGPTATARALGISQPSVSGWPDEVPKGRQAHVRLVMQIEQARRDKIERQARKKAQKEERRDVREPETAANQ